MDGDPHRRDRRVVRSIGRLERHVAGVAVPLEVVGHRLEFGPNLSHRPVRRADRAGKCSVEVLLVILQRCRGCLDGSEINWRAAVAFEWFGHVSGPLVEVVWVGYSPASVFHFLGEGASLQSEELQHLQQNLQLKTCVHTVVQKWNQWIDSALSVEEIMAGMRKKN